MINKKVFNLFLILIFNNPNILGYTIYYINNSSKYIINKGEITVSNTLIGCPTSSNDIVLLPGKFYPDKSTYQDAYISAKCKYSCFDYFKVLDNSFDIRNETGNEAKAECRSHTIELTDDGVYYEGYHDRRKVMNLPYGLTITRFPGFNIPAYFNFNPTIKADQFYGTRPTNHFYDIGSKKQAMIQIDIPNANPVIGKFIGINKFLQNNYDLVKSLKIQYSDAVTKFQKVFEYFVNTGAKEGRQIVTALPLGGFNEKKYLELNPDVAASPYYSKNPRQHFLDHGYKENRLIQIDAQIAIPPSSNTGLYTAKNWPTESQVAIFGGIDNYLNKFPYVADKNIDQIPMQLSKIFNDYTIQGNKTMPRSIFEPKSARCDQMRGKWQNNSCTCPQNYQWTGSDCVCSSGYSQILDPLKQFLPRCVSPEEKSCILLPNGNPSKRIWDDVAKKCKCLGNLIYNGTDCVCPAGLIPIFENYCGTQDQKTCHDIDPANKYDLNKKVCVCSKGRIWNGKNCICPTNLVWNPNLYCISQDQQTCIDKQGVWDGSKCTFPQLAKICTDGGGTWDDKTNSCTCSGGRIWGSGICQCPMEALSTGSVQQKWDGTKCVSGLAADRAAVTLATLKQNCLNSNGAWDDQKNICNCQGNKIWNGSDCVCPAGTTYYNNQCMGTDQINCLKAQPNTGQIWDSANSKCICPSSFPNFVNNKCVTQAATACAASGGTFDAGRNSCTCPTGQTWINNQCMSQIQQNCISDGGTWSGTTCICPTNYSWFNNHCITALQKLCTDSGGTIGVDGKCLCPSGQMLSSDGTCTSNNLLPCAMQGGSWDNTTYICTCPFNRIWNKTTKTCDCPAGYPVHGAAGTLCLSRTDCPIGISNDISQCGKCYARWDSMNSNCNIQ